MFVGNKNITLWKGEWLGVGVTKSVKTEKTTDYYLNWVCVLPSLVSEHSLLN